MAEIKKEIKKEIMRSIGRSGKGRLFIIECAKISCILLIDIQLKCFLGNASSIRMKSERRSSWHCSTSSPARSETQ